MPPRKGGMPTTVRDGGVERLRTDPHRCPRTRVRLSLTSAVLKASSKCRTRDTPDVRDRTTPPDTTRPRQNGTVECGSVKRLEVLGRGWSGPEVRTSGAANRRRRDRRRRGGILVGQGEWWSPFGVKGHGEPGFGPRSVEVMAAHVRVPWAYLRHAAAAGDMKPCGHDHRELTHLDSTTPGGGSCRYCEPPDGRGPILTPRHWRGSGSRRRAARSRRASTAVGRRRRVRCCGHGGLRREL